MNLIITIISLLVAVEFLYIMYLETFATTSPNTTKTFNMSETDLQSKKIQTLLKNQGVYNGLISVGIIYSLFSHITTTTAYLLL